MEIRIIPTRGYYSAFVNGSLYCTADTYFEAVRELENDGLIQLLKTKIILNKTSMPNKAERKLTS